METLVAGGLIADIALAAIVLEALALWWFARRSGRPGLLPAFAPFLVAGFCLIVALKAALAGWPAAVVVAALTLSGVAHAVDLAQRLRG